MICLKNIHDRVYGSIEDDFMFSDEMIPKEGTLIFTQTIHAKTEVSYEVKGFESLIIITNIPEERVLTWEIKEDESTIQKRKTQ